MDTELLSQTVNFLNNAARTTEECGEVNVNVPEALFCFRCCRAGVKVRRRDWEEMEIQALNWFYSDGKRELAT